MKILLHHFTPFALAHGDLQSQIVRTREALLSLGVDVEYLRWYDGSQTGDLLHFFGPVPKAVIDLARQKGMKVVLTAQGPHSARILWLQRASMRALEKAVPALTASAFDWQSYRTADACIASTKGEARLMIELFRVAPDKLHVIPNGVEQGSLESHGAPNSKPPPKPLTWVEVAHQLKALYEKLCSRHT